jgi:integrase
MKPAGRKLTKATVAALTLPRRRNEILVFDSELPGFGVRLREGGSKTWIFQYKLGNKHRRITLGRVAALEPAVAREQANKLHAQVRLGQDPAGAKAESRAHADETFGACVAVFLAWQRGRVKSFRDVERHLVRNLAALHNLPLAKIDQRTVAAQLARISARGSPIQANRTRASLSKFFNWACGEGLTENNPAALCNRNSETSRDRVLSRNELKKVWAALPDNDYGDILKLLVLTGQRATEISDLQWSEIDFERGLISLPPSRIKNKRRHIVPMAVMVRAILEARPQNGREFVFGEGQRRGFTGWSRAKAALDEVVKIPSWRVHDLRRVVSTGMNEIGVPPWIVEAVINHIAGQSAVSRTYNHALYENEKASALNRWAEYVTAIVEGRDSKLMPLRGVS